jgi:hypothetical protein
LLVVFEEDLVALIGLFFAFLAILVALITGNPVYDAAGPIAIGVLLIFVAILVGGRGQESGHRKIYGYLYPKIGQLLCITII